MEAISRNTASVAQDFHNAGGVDLRIQQKKHSNNISNNHINLPLKKINKEAASLQNHKNNNNNNDVILENDELKAMSNFLSNFQLREKVNNDVEVKSPPAINHFHSQQPKQIPITKGHRLQDKENSIFNKMEMDFLQNYVKNIINKYYNYNYKTYELQATTRSKENQITLQKNETEEYIEYLKNKTDITLTVTTVIKKQSNQTKNVVIPQASIVPVANAIDLSCAESKSRNRKQCKPRKIETPTELLMLALKAKHTKESISACRKKCYKCGLIVLRSRYNLHCLLKHSERLNQSQSFKCLKCEKEFKRKYSLSIHHKSIHSSK